ncbi:hypothetical protein IMZ31_22225 (plasmid) [Pontibacillus sp. ALD_SL1]|nr:hypothetical protein [Pontibacillus sp. ALD_SL1]QST02172.1 hypothetical protein IMZ31_22225 [Pontibacillus sp. ALD_SL1]
MNAKKMIQKLRMKTLQQFWRNKPSLQQKQYQNNVDLTKLKKEKQQ